MLFLVVIPHFRQKMRLIAPENEALFGFCWESAFEQRLGVATSLPKSLQSSRDGNLTSGWLSLAQGQ